MRLLTLGDAALTAQAPNDTAEKVLLRPGKPLALLAYLAANTRRTASREHLIDLLWGDAERERGRQSLRQAILLIRRHLGADAIVTVGETVTLVSTIRSDRDDFLEAVSSEDDEGAIRLYRGPYLRRMAFPGAQGFEEWVEFESLRIEQLFLQAAESSVRTALASGRSLEALRIARIMRDTRPERESAWRLIFQAALALNDRVALALEADAYKSQLVLTDRRAEAATWRLLTEVRDALAQSRAGQAASILAATAREPLARDSTPNALVADLAGREREFATLLSAWGRAQSTCASVVTIEGSAGLGKSRLLAELRARLRSAGHRIVLIRAHPADHEISLTLASDIVKAVCALPGAAGISQASGEILIGLAPSVAGYFPGVTPDRNRQREVSSAHVHALAELVAAVAAEAPFAIALDDLQWADTASVALLGSLLGRVEDSRVMIVIASRQDVNIARDAVTLRLQGLGQERVREMLASIGDIEALERHPAFIAGLTQSTGGSPLLLLETLQFSLDTGILHLRDDRWEVPDTDALDRLIREPHAALRRRISALGVEERGVMLLLAVAGAPVRHAAIEVATARSNLRPTLDHLEQRGFIRRRGDSVELAHDEYADGVMSQANEQEQAEAHSLLGRALLSEVRTVTSDAESFRDFQRGVRHAAAGGDEDTVTRRGLEWLSRNRQDSRSDRQAVRELLGAFATESRTSAILHGRPLGRRLLGGSGIARRAAFASLLVLAVALVVGATLWWTAVPYRLRMVEEPLSVDPILPAPVVELQSRSGARVSRHDSVRVVAEGQGRGRVEGITKVPLSDGRATFGNLRLVLPESEKGEGVPYRLRFYADGVGPAYSVRLSSEETGPTGWSNLRLVRGVVNGHRIDAQHRTIALRPGERLIGQAQLEYTTRWGSAAVMLGLTPSWGDRRKAFRELSALPTPVANGIMTVSMDLAVPDRPGDYAVIFAFAAEARVDWIFSGTNWQVGAPVWGDGNDLQDWTASQWDSADRIGVVGSRVLHPGHDYRLRYVPATTIRVHVAAGSIAQSSTPHGVGGQLTGR